MSKMRKLNQQIKYCHQEIEQQEDIYQSSKQQVRADLKTYIPLLSNIGIASGIILFISPRARRVLGYISRKIFVELLNVRIGMLILSKLFNTFKFSHRLFYASVKQLNS